MTELGRRQKGRECQAYPGLRAARCPRRVITLGNLVSVPLSVSPLSTSSCPSHIPQGSDTPEFPWVCPFNAACSRWDSQITHTSVVTGIRGWMCWSNQRQFNLSLWRHTTLAWRFWIWTSGIYKFREIAGKIIYTDDYAHCSGERVHTLYLILSRFCSLTMLKLYTQ